MLQPPIVTIIHGVRFTEVNASQWKLNYPGANPETRLYHVCSGGGNYRAGGKGGVFRPGYFYLLPQSMPLQLWTSGSMGVYWSHVRLFDASGVDYFQLYKPEVVELGEIPGGLAEWFDGLAEYSGGESLSGQLYELGVIHELLAEFWGGRQPESIILEGGGDREMRQLAVRLARGGGRGQPKCGELARSCGMGESIFYVEFKRCFGMTPARYFRRMRLEKARRLLCCTSEKLQSIALETGFSDAFHLSKLFKSEFGVSPSEYRKSQLWLP